MSKYFQIGFNRCGTTAIANFATRSGIPAIHWDKGRLAPTLDSNLRLGRRVDHKYEKFEVFTDMEFMDETTHIEIYKQYSTLMTRMPEAKFILNIRNRENWIKSRFNFLGKRHINNYKVIYGLRDKQEVIDYWCWEWHVHLSRVQADVPPEKLLVFDIEQDDPVELCRFMGLSDQHAKYWNVEKRSMYGGYYTVDFIRKYPYIRKIIGRTPTKILKSLVTRR